MSKYPRIICNICSKNFGQEKIFIEHIKSEHSIESSEELYCNWNNIIPKKCFCGCNENVRWDSWKYGYSESNYRLGHNAKIYTSFSNPVVIEKMKEKRKEGFESGRIKSWNTGLTKETNEILKQSSIKKSKTLKNSYNSGELKPWQGREGSEKSYKKISDTKKKLFLSGELKSWNTGLTKETNDILKKVSENISLTINSKPKIRGFGRIITTEKFKKRFYNTLGDIFEPLFSFDDYYNVKNDKLKVKCKTCNVITEKCLMLLESAPLCYSCYPKESRGQIEVYEFVKSICEDVILSDRKQLEHFELDVYVPNKKYGIEYNGLYWHSEKLNKNKEYHLEKTNAANDKGIRLFHLYEDEWKNKQDIVKSIIKNALGVSHNKIGARSCVIKNLNSKEKKEFFDKNHLDGDTRSKIAYGLYFNNKLVSAISLRKPFHAKWSTYLEIARFCCLLDHNVVGSLGKLTNHVIRMHHTPLLSYIDKRFGGEGKAYLKSGWTLDGETNERFWWTDFIGRYDRFWCRADRIRGLTENQVAEERGVYRIWGVGNKRFVILQ